MLHVGYTGGTPGCLLDRSEGHFHGFLTISVCPSDDFSTFWGRQNVIKHTSFKMLQTQMFSSNLGRTILRMLLARFLALVLYYSTSPAACLLQLLYYHSCCYIPSVAILLLRCDIKMRLLHPCTHSCSYINSRAATPAVLLS